MFQGQYGGQFEAVSLSSLPHGDKILSFGQEVLALAGLPQDLLYARVDLALAKKDLALAKEDLHPVLMELEVLEPDLFTGGNREAGITFARAIRGLLDRRPGGGRISGH